MISLIALGGAALLFLRKELLDKILLILVSFASGSLVGGAFLHLIPEAIEKVVAEGGDILQVFFLLIFGFCVFYILENFIGWHHHHGKEHPEYHLHSRDIESGIKPFAYLILIADSIHNFIDGLIIATSFLISLPLGLVSAVAVALHEIPQEIGDFGVLVYGGIEKIKALFLNFLSASSIVFGGLFGFFIAEQAGERLLFFLPFSAGSFIYIATSDLIPQIKAEREFKKSAVYFLVFLVGIMVMVLIKKYLS